jgi:hypothetical protein
VFENGVILQEDSLEAIRQRTGATVLS